MQRRMIMAETHLTKLTVQKMLDQMFRGDAPSYPATWYFALATAVTKPSPVNDDWTITEVNTGTQWSNYARVGLTNNSTNFATTASSSTGRTKATSASGAVSFGTATIIGSTSIVAVALYDASTSGNLMAVFELAAAKTITNSDVVSIPAQSFSLYVPRQL